MKDSLVMHKMQNAATDRDLLQKPTIPKFESIFNLNILWAM